MENMKLNFIKKYPLYTLERMETSIGKNIRTWVKFAVETVRK